MKKTIAKIMAAAMVLSTVVAPNALAATISAGTAVKIADLTFAGEAIYQDGEFTNNYFDVELTSAAALDLIGINSSTYAAASEYYIEDNTSSGSGAVAASIYVNAGTNPGESTNVDAAVTTATSSALADKATLNSTGVENLEASWTQKKVATSKITVNGKYNDTVESDDIARWYRILWNGTTVTPQFKTDYATFDTWMAKLRNGGIVVGYAPVVNAAGATLFTIPVRLRVVGVGTDGDDYWNGIVQLKGNNDTFIPIRVRYTVESGTYLENTTIAMNVTGNGLVFADGSRVSLTQLSSRRLQLVAVNPYDLELLKSDTAKGKNLILNDVYTFDESGLLNDNGLYSAMSQYDDWGVLNVNEDIKVVSVGKINTIHSQLFKGAKEKFVKAEYAKFINNGAFRKNKQLKKAYIGNEKNLKKVNSKAFYDCKKLATVKLSGKALKNVGSGAFKNCKSNMIFKIKGNSTQVKKAWAKIKKQAPAKAKYAKI